MVKRKIRWIACILAWLLVMAATPLGALADSWTLTANLPTSKATALTTNSKMIDLTVTFNNVVDIKCLVKPDGSQAIRTYENPQIQGNQATFSGVLLSPGINEITFIGTSGSLQVQSPTYYVEYLNNPRIMNVQLQGVNIDNDSVAAVSFTPPPTNPNAVPTVSWQYDTENATQSTVNGTTVVGAPVGTKQTWTTSLKLTPGEMPVTTVASNSQRSVAVQKSVILLDPVTKSAPYGVVLDAGSQKANLWAGSKVQVSGTTPLTLEGYFVAPQSTSTTPTIQVSIDGGSYQPANVDPNVASWKVKWIKQWGTQDQLAVWTWNADLSGQTINTGDHTISLQFTVDGNTSQTLQYSFTFVDTSLPYWSNPVQLLNVNWDNTQNPPTVQAGQTISVIAPWTVSQVPVDLGLTLNNVANFDKSKLTVRAENIQGGPIDLTSSTKIGILQSQNNQAQQGQQQQGQQQTPTVVVIEFPAGALRAGEYDLVFSYNYGGSTPAEYRLHTIVQLSPMLKVTLKQNGNDLADGQVVTDSAAVSVTVQPVNFSQISNLKGTVNGIDLPLSQNGNEYTASGIQLSEGANTFRFTATDSQTNMTVETTITVYKATPLNASIPEFEALLPESGQVLPYNADTQTFSTSSQRVDLKLKVGPIGNTQGAINKIELYENGSLLTTVFLDNSQNHSGYAQTKLNNDTWWYDQQYIDNKNISVDSNGNIDLRISYKQTDPKDGSIKWLGIAMPPNQTTSFKVVAYFQNGNAISQQVTRTILVANQLKPYEIFLYEGGQLKGPFDVAQTIQVNQNYLDVVIATPFPADAVTINRQPAVQWNNPPGGDPTKYYYGVELQNLKPGLNKIPFTVQSGTSKESGTLLVNNLDQALTYAKAKVYFGKSNSITVFDKALSLKFDRNTMLAPAVYENGGMPSSTNATNDRYLLFGIAHPANGRITEDDSATGNRFMSVPDRFPPGGWAVASPVFWIDAGPVNFEHVNLPPFVPPGGIDPYYSDPDPDYEDTYKFDQRGSSSEGPNDWMQPTKDGTLTLAYDPAIRDQEAGRLAVFYLDLGAWRNGASPSPWINLGGVVNTSNHTISVPFRHFGYYVVAKEVYSYQDVASHSWAKDYLETMYSKGIMVADPALVDLFNPDVPITRGEFTTMVVKMLGLPLDYDDNHRLFIDVGRALGGLYDYRYIETAARKGIVHGVGPNIFRPGDPLTRQEAAVIIAAALNLKTTDPKAAKTALSRLYGDANAVDPYAAPAVLAVSQKKIMEGSPAPGSGSTGGKNQKPVMYFNPASQLTRAEAAAIAYNVMKQLKKL